MFLRRGRGIIVGTGMKVYGICFRRRTCWILRVKVEEVYPNTTTGERAIVVLWKCRSEIGFPFRVVSRRVEARLSSISIKNC